MRPSCSAPMRLAVSLALPCLLAIGALPAAGSIEGRWRLIEAGRGSGEARPTSPGETRWIEFQRDPAGLGGSGLTGRTWTAGSAATPRAWPSFDSEGTPLPVRVEALAVEPGFSGVSVRYRAGPLRPGGREIVIEESYRLGDGGRSLEADIRVTDVVDGEDGGSYLLHRRYGRER